MVTFQAPALLGAAPELPLTPRAIRSVMERGVPTRFCMHIAAGTTGGSLDMGYNSTGAYNLGTDQSIIITNEQTGASVTLDGRRTSFTSEDGSKIIEGEAVDNGGLIDAMVLPGRWTGTIEVERAGPDFSSLYAFMEQQFYAGAPRYTFTIESYEPAADKQSVSVFQYTKTIFHGYKPGTWARERVKSSVSFSAQQRLQVA